MNARVAGRARASVPVAATIVTGLGLLAWRLRLAGLEDPVRSVALALVLGAVLVASLLVPATETRPQVGHVMSVVIAGLVVFGLTAALVGHRPPVPWGATAIGLSLLAAVAEESLFRRVLYDRLLRFGPVFAVAVTALAFSLLHVPAYGWVAFPVDLGAGLVFGWQRHASGTWTAPALTHAAVNLVVTLR